MNLTENNINNIDVKMVRRLNNLLDRMSTDFIERHILVRRILRTYKNELEFIAWKTDDDGDFFTYE